MADENQSDGESSIGGKFFRLFVKPEDEKAEPKAAVTKPVAVAPAQVVTTATPVATGLDQEMVESLNKIILTKITPFTSLQTTIDKLKAVPMDDNTRLQAAITMTTAEGRTVEQIIKAIEMHIADVDREVARFTQASQAASATKVQSLRSSATALSETKESNLKKIAELQDLIQSLQQTNTDNDVKIVDLNNQADQAEAEIANVNARFVAAAEHVKVELNNKKLSLTK